MFIHCNKGKKNITWNLISEYCYINTHTGLGTFSTYTTILCSYVALKADLKLLTEAVL